MSISIYNRYHVDNEVATCVEQRITEKMKYLLEEAKKITMHCHRKTMTVSDLQTAMRILCYDKIFGYSNETTTKFHEVDSESKRIKLEDSIVSVKDIIDARITEIPQDQTYSVSWLVINGRQIDHIPEFHGEEEDQDTKKPNISVRDSSIHSLSFECELYLKNIKQKMFSNSTQRSEIYHQLRVDEGLKQILPYLVHYIQNEVQSIMKTKPENMLSYLDYLMHISHSLVLNTHLNTVLYLHLLLPGILSCCVGKTLSASPVEDHWALRDLSSLMISDINRLFGCDYPKMQRQIYITLNKVLHNPKSTLPSVYGAIQCIRGLGDRAIDTLLLPVCKEMSENLHMLLKSVTKEEEKDQSNVNRALAHMQIQRCLHALTELMGLVAAGALRGIEVNYASPAICAEFEKKLDQLPNTRDMVLTEVALPLCRQHVDGSLELWDAVI